MEAIVAEVGHCGLCGHRLPEDAVSDYFCGQGHQDLYYRDRSEPIDEVRLYHRWRDQEIPGDRIRAAMDDLQGAFAGFGESARQAGEALNRLTDAAE